MKLSCLPVLAVLLLSAAVFGYGQKTRPVMRLVNVENVYVDEGSFRFTFSSCGTYAGGMLLPCAKHAVEREEFLIVLKRWLGKCGFTVVADKRDADATVQGTLAIDDNAHRPAINSKDRKANEHYHNYEPQWTVESWMINSADNRIWQRRHDYPDISYKSNGQAKIEGKKLAKAIEYDFKKGR